MPNPKPPQASLDEYVEVIAPHLPRQLVSAAALAHIRTVARLLPPATGTVFECRLDEHASAVDLIVMFQPPDGGREQLAGSRPSVLPDALFTQLAWSRVRDFCREWAAPTSAWSEQVADIWLEFDLDGPPPVVPIPGFFAAFRETAADEPGGRGGAELDPQALAVLVVEKLLAEPISPRLRRNLAACFSALPPGARVFSLGIWFSRATDAVRLCISGISNHELLPYLQRIGWSPPSGLHRDSPQLGPLLSQFLPVIDRVSLALDIGATVRPKVGLECYLNELDPSKEPRWRQLMARIVDTGLGTPQKCDALLTWYGYSDERAHPANWPRNLRLATGFLGPNVRSMLVRQFNHVKIVVDPERGCEAKAYLAVRHVLAAGNTLGASGGARL